MKKRNLKQRPFNNPFSRILFGLLVCFGVVIIGQEIAGNLLTLLGPDRDYRNLFKGIIVSLLALGSYSVFFKFIEKRTITEISTKNIAKNVIVAILIGIVLQSLTILVIYASNGFKIVSINPISFIIIPLTVAFTVAIFDEILIRGIVFRIMEEKLGSYTALLISVLLFSTLYVLNPNSSLISGASVGIEGGLLLGAAFIYTRNLWFPIAIHFA